jgi:small GTP-binding protein
MIVFDNYSKNIIYEGQAVSLKLWDTAGQEDYDRLRPLSYTRSDFLLICFSVDSPASFNNVKTKWVPEARAYAANAPWMLVGTKSDLRDQYAGGYDEDGNYIEFVSVDSARKMAQQLGASGYMECSALTQAGLKDLFGTVVKHVMQTRGTKSDGGCCTLM